MNYFDYFQVTTLIVFLLVFFGRTIFLINSNLFFLMCFVCMAIGFHLQVRQEEEFLIGRYGDKYRKYMAQVRKIYLNEDFSEFKRDHHYAEDRID